MNATNDAASTRRLHLMPDRADRQIALHDLNADSTQTNCMYIDHIVLHPLLRHVTAQMYEPSRSTRLAVSIEVQFVMEVFWAWDACRAPGI